MEFAFCLHGNMVQKTGRACPVADFRGGSRGISALNAFQPVTVVIATLVQMYFIWSDDTVENLGIAGHQRFHFHARFGRIACSHLGVPGDKDPSFGAVPFDAVRKVSADVHGHAVFIDRVGEKLAMNIP